MSDFNSGLYRFIGERIKKLRNQLSISQEDLANKVGIGRTSISNIELGRHQAPLHLLYKISDALGTEIHIFLPTTAEINDYLSSSKKELFDILNQKGLSKSTREEIEKHLKHLLK